MESERLIMNKQATILGLPIHENCTVEGLAVSAIFSLAIVSQEEPITDSQRDLFVGILSEYLLTGVPTTDQYKCSTTGQCATEHFEEFAKEVDNE